MNIFLLVPVVGIQSFTSFSIQRYVIEVKPNWTWDKDIYEYWKVTNFYHPLFLVSSWSASGKSKWVFQQLCKIWWLSTIFKHHSAEPKAKRKFVNPSVRYTCRNITISQKLMTRLAIKINAKSTIESVKFRKNRWKFLFQKKSMLISNIFDVQRNVIKFRFDLNLTLIQFIFLLHLIWSWNYLYFVKGLPCICAKNRTWITNLRLQRLGSSLVMRNEKARFHGACIWISYYILRC